MPNGQVTVKLIVTIFTNSHMLSINNQYFLPLYRKPTRFISVNVLRLTVMLSSSLQCTVYYQQSE